MLCLPVFPFLASLSLSAASVAIGTMQPLVLDLDTPPKGFLPPLPSPGTRSWVNFYFSFLRPRYMQRYRSDKERARQPN